MCPLIRLPRATRQSFPFTINITISRMDPTSAALCEVLDPTEPRTYAALSKSSNIPPTTLWYRARGQPSKQEKAKRQRLNAITVMRY